MFQTLSKKLRNRKGFTLIELIVVLAILGIILAIAVPNYLGVQSAAAADADRNSGELVVNSVKLWYAAENVVTEGFTIAAPTGEETAYTFAKVAETDVLPSDIQQAALNNYLEAWPASASSTTELVVTVTTQTDITNTWSDFGK
jgi:prepilin-type N-terminal cleavage/methylation domain-containing protein